MLQKAGNTDNIEFTYNHADWLLREKRIHGGYTPLTTYRDHSYDEFGRMIFDGLFPDFSFETGLVFNMTYNDRDQMVTKKLGGITNPLDKIRYNYTERGWLNQMNDIVYLEDGAGLCDDPVSAKPKQIEQEVDLEDLLDLIVSDPNLVINSLDPCEVTDCFERRASYRITVQNPPSTDTEHYENVDACIEQLYGETGAIPLPNYPYCLFTQNEVNQLITDLSAWLDSGFVYDEISSSYNSATKTYTIDITGSNYEFTGIEVECLRNFYFVIPKPDGISITNSNVTEIKYNGGNTVPLGVYCWGTGGQLATDLKNWLQGPGGYTVSNVTYVSAGRDIGKVSILGTNFPLESVLMYFDCLSDPVSEDDYLKKPYKVDFTTNLTPCWGYLEKRNQELRPCKFPPGTNPGTDVQQPASIDDLDDIIDASTPANVPLPNVLYQVKLLDGSVRWVFKTELGTIKGNYDRLTEIPVTSSDQIFTIKKTDGSTIQTDLAGLLNERKLGTIDDIPVPPTTPPPAADPCAPLAPLGCTDLEQQAQNQSLALILNDMASLDISTLQYPVQIHLVRLCDGSTAYIMDQFLGDLEGSHLTIGSITVTSSDQLFNVTAVQSEPIFAMAFNYEANGNISRAEWQTTFHRSQFYDYAYDPLNRLLSAQYGEVVPSYAVVGGAFQKFVYQINNNYNENSLTYDGDGNIKTLQRMGLSDANNCASKVQIDNLLYTLIPGTPRLQKVADSAPAANRAKGFNPGASPGSDYVYDQNGNLITDPYKGLTIQYNFLNLPKQITKGGSSITVRYDVTGRKWSQTGPEGLREYVDRVEYLNEKIESIQHGGGRLVSKYDSGGISIESFRVEYSRQDHLGNTRISFCDFNLDGIITTKDDPNTPENEVEITQENHYYPFGFCQEGPWYTDTEPNNKYLYANKEYTKDLGLNWNDYGARWYDPAIGRWGQIDKLADRYISFSPYSYALLNPVRLIDPNGMEVTSTFDPSDLSKEKLEESQKRLDALMNPSKTNSESGDDWKDLTRSDIKTFGSAVRNSLIKKGLSGKNLEFQFWAEMGVILEIAVLQSIEMPSNSQNFKGAVPDAVGVIVNGKWWHGLLNRAIFIEVKVGPYVPSRARDRLQILRMIEYLGGHRIQQDGIAPALIIITPANVDISDEIKNTANAANVVLFQANVEYNVRDHRIIRVKPAKQVNDVLSNYDYRGSTKKGQPAVMQY